MAINLFFNYPKDLIMVFTTQSFGTTKCFPFCRSPFFGEQEAPLFAAIDFCRE